MYPIIYVRGYAMTTKERNETTADPFCGFNAGSTVYRATTDRKKAAKFVFESPVIRLSTDFGYSDVFEDGYDIMDQGWDGKLSAKSIVIYRYYESGSDLLGDGKAKDIREYAKGLSDLILRVRDLVCANRDNGIKEADFKCHLVAHSMGGLVCRAFLQNPKLGDDRARKCVDKFFTYATPHNGIEAGSVNVPEWLGACDINNFNRENMADYLNLGAVFAKTKRVDWMPESAIPADRVFCMVGTNRSDYDAAAGLSRTFVGQGSDGLVRIENASVWGIDDQGAVTKPAATAYAYRAHSGYFGIVNSEEAYQNLIRFLFGDVRVDIWADIESVSLPQKLQAPGFARKVNALYQLEVLASPRGKPWFLTRRVAEEDSVACRTHQEIVSGDAARKSVYLSTTFLGNRWKVNPQRRSLAYSVKFAVRVPDYEVNNKLWFNEHFEGRDLFNDMVTVELSPPAKAGGLWRVDAGWTNPATPRVTTTLDAATIAKGAATILIPFEDTGTPGIKGNLRFGVAAWNTE
jgi:hypothetical protein